MKMMMMMMKKNWLMIIIINKIKMMKMTMRINLFVKETLLKQMNNNFCMCK